MTNRQKLYRIATIALELSDYRNVPLDWFVDKRTSPIQRPYAELVAGYDPLDEYHVYSEGAVDELFNAAEVEAFVAWLKMHPRYCGTTVTEVALPLPGNAMGIGAIPVGGLQDFLCPMDAGKPVRVPPLGFEVMGYFDLRHCEREPLKKRHTVAPGRPFSVPVADFDAGTSQPGFLEPLHRKERTQMTMTTENRADTLNGYLYFIDSIDADWLSDIRDAGKLLESQNLWRLDRIASALDEIENEAKAQGFADVVAQATLERRAITDRISFRIGLDLVSKDPFERDLARLRYEIAAWISAIEYDESMIIRTTQAKGFEVRDLVKTPEGTPTPCFVANAVFIRDGIERAAGVPPIVVAWDPPF